MSQPSSTGTVSTESSGKFGTSSRRRYPSLAEPFSTEPFSTVSSGVVYAGNKWDGASHFFLFDTLGTTGLLLSLVLLERLTVRSKAERHPISGSPRAALDVECDQVIAKAPAGSVWLEKTLTGFFVGSLVAGPGFAASMWWCSGEEELGWKSRKAWREAVAVDGKKNK